MEMHGFAFLGHACLDNGNMVEWTNLKEKTVLVLNKPVAMLRVDSHALDRWKMPS